MKKNVVNAKLTLQMQSIKLKQEMTKNESSGEINGRPNIFTVYTAK